MIIETARTESEVDEAYKLALNVFKEQSTTNNYDHYKALLWKQDPSYDPSNFLLLKDSDCKVIGIVRIIPRIVYRAHQQFEVAGISSECIDASLRGQDLSIPLIETTLKICTKRGFDLALLFARRATDHYYSRFGFWGLSSYNRVTLSKPKTVVKDSSHNVVDIAGLRSEDIGIYRKAYENCYANTFGRMARNEGYWNYLIKKISSTREINLMSITKEGQVVGYLVKSKDAIHEIAYIDDLSALQLIHILNSTPPLATNMAWELEISPDHKLISSLSDMDVTIRFRECNYGGHMIRILNRDRVTKLLSERLRDKFDRYQIKSFSFKDDDIAVTWDGADCFAFLQNALSPFSTYRQTCKSLGIYAHASRTVPLDDPASFNISLLDQF